MTLKTATQLSALALALVLPATEVRADDWTGGYVGGALGYAWGYVDAGDAAAKSKVKGLDQFIDAFNAINDPTGTDVSLYAGYMWQTGPLLIGAEAQIRSGGLDERVTIADLSFENTYALRGILGTEVSDTLIFASFGVVSTDFGEVFSFGGDQGRETGYTIGIGAERMLTDTLSLRAELTHDRYRFDLDLGGGPGDPPELSIDQTRFTIGATWRF